MYHVYCSPHKYRIMVMWVCLTPCPTCSSIYLIKNGSQMDKVKNRAQGNLEYGEKE